MGILRYAQNDKRRPIGSGMTPPHPGKRPKSRTEMAKKEFRPGKRGVFPDGTFIGADADYFSAFLRAAAAVASYMMGVPIMIEA